MSETNEEYATVSWRVLDLTEQYGLTQDQAVDVLNYLSDDLYEVMVQAGWEVFENYLPELGLGRCDTCRKIYDTSSRDGRCGDCGDCGEHCECDKVCLNCTNRMNSEWGSSADDAIQLCHACYSNDNLIKYQYVRTDK